MITLYTFGPALELPDPSPFVMKAMLLLKMAGLDFRTDSRFSRFRKAPKGKLPYIDDAGTIVAGSSFIRRHIEATYGFDFDAGLDRRDKAIAHAVATLLEESFYWAIVYARWVEPQNWATLKREFFRKLPVPLRLVVPVVARRKVRGDLRSQGLGRQSPAEVRLIADAMLQAIADLLSDKPYLMGDCPCGADATLLAFLLAATEPAFMPSVVDGVGRFPALVAYMERGRARYFAS